MLTGLVCLYKYQLGLRKTPMLVLIGHFNAHGRPETKGTGFIVARGMRRYIVTCRHTVDVIDPARLIAIKIPRAKVFPESPEDYIQLTEPVFHPKDSEQQSHDVVVYEVTRNAKQLNDTSISALQFETLLNEPSIAIGTSLQINGFSVAYLTKNFNPASNEYLSPEFTSAKVAEAPLNLLRVNRFHRNLGQVQFCATLSGEVVGDGTSGGPIFRLPDNICVGMLIASVNATYTFPNGYQMALKGGRLSSR